MEQKEISVGLMRSEDADDEESKMLIDKEEEEESNSNQPPCWNIFSYVIPPLYCLLTIGILGAYITGFVLTELQGTLLMALLAGAMVISMFSAWMVYISPSFHDQIDRLEEENDNYKDQLYEMKKTRKNLGRENEALEGTVENLQNDADILEAETEQFEGLVDQLGGIAKDRDAIHDILGETTSLFSKMKKVILQHEKSQLLTLYYECAFRDNDDTMDKAEYTRFLGRLPKKERERVKAIGTFEEIAGEDDQIDLHEFEGLLDEFLKVDEDILVDEFSDM